MVTVFTRPVENGFYHAATIRTEALGRSEELAAALAAARFFGRDEAEIEVIRETDHVMVGSIKPPVPKRKSWRTLTAIKPKRTPLAVATIEGISHSRAERTVPIKTVALLCALFLAVGFYAAVWSIGMIATATP